MFEPPVFVNQLLATQPLQSPSLLMPLLFLAMKMSLFLILFIFFVSISLP